MNSLYQYRDLPGNRNPPISDKNEALKNPPKIPGENSTGRNAGEKGKLAGCDYKEAFVC